MTGNRRTRCWPLLGAAFAVALASATQFPQARNLEFASVDLAAPPQANGVLLVGFKKSDVVSINFDRFKTDSVSLSSGRLRQDGVVPDAAAVEAAFHDGVLVVKAAAPTTEALVVLIRWPHAARPQAPGREKTYTPFTITTDGAPSTAVLFPALQSLVLHDDRLSPLPWCRLVENLALSPDAPCPR